ncbi:uncharacterized protein LOC8275757 [Ricinus communis]|uniref:Transmembrane protein n=1 Tax=Ricinus communis TaxID=3988 RepID=B9RZL3_RICCO|nr:uncharacterized protein LOC8275757 [Ricinus communis]EEF43046.1 conserved hypothetical protein [Ricinus communis]|eukprot:XP_002519182.1 uncharacterized protein LOC8275757 [Ricinus communis]
MPKPITHADLAPGPRSTDLGSKTAAFLTVLTIFCGFFCFVLCLIAETTRSRVTWVASNGEGSAENHECIYSGSGKTPLLCAAVAFVGLAIGMVVEHMYILIAISKSPPSVLITWDSNSPPAKTITWQAGFFFVATWVCFAVGEILLLIGLSVESGHLKNWSRPKSSCLVIKQGLFSAAGVLSLATVFLAAGLYVIALRAQRISQEHENLRQQILEASALYASPPESPRRQITVTARENPIARENQIVQPPIVDSTAFSKHFSLA